MHDCMTCSVTSPVVTRGDEKSSPWNPLPCVCKVISPLEKALTHVHTHTHTLCVSTFVKPLLPSLHYLPVLLRATRRWGQRAQSPFQSGSLGLPWNLHPWVWGPTLLHSPIVKEENEEEGSCKQKKERANTQRGETQLISHVLEGLLVIVPVKRAECKRDGA